MQTYQKLPKHHHTEYPVLSAAMFTGKTLDVTRNPFTVYCLLSLATSSTYDPDLTRKCETATRTRATAADVTALKEHGTRLVFGSRVCLQELGYLHLITMPIPICLLVTLACCQESLYF